MPDLIFTSGNNERHARLTLEQGWLVGLRSDTYAYDVPIHFVDNEYKSPNFAQHLAMVKRLRPRYATVPDLSETEVSQEDVRRALHQAECLSEYCEVVYLVPKLLNQIAYIPREMAIAYSVPTTYGGIKHLPIELMYALEGRRLHLLGGSPHVQMELYRYLSCYAEVLSVDGNMFQLVSGFGKYWKHGKWIKHPKQGQKPRDPNVTYECIAWSLHNIRRAWERETTQHTKKVS